MGGLFSPQAPTVQPAPVAPSLADDTVQKEAANAMKNRQGRASTMLTNPQTQRTAGADDRTYLTGA